MERVTAETHPSSLSQTRLFGFVTPQVPIHNPPKGAEFGRLFTAETPRIEGIYLVTSTGLLVTALVREETRLDPDIFASMLSTVGEFVKETMSKFGRDSAADTLTRIDYGDRSILIEREDDLTLALIITGEETELLLHDVRARLDDLHREFGRSLTPWSGDEDDVRGVGGMLTPLMSRYDGKSAMDAEPSVRRNVRPESVKFVLTKLKAVASPQRGEVYGKNPSAVHRISRRLLGRNGNGRQTKDRLAW
jgi:predicted regulator of Ras-like GTPase activity (Roadblock/LC7/MglB family)